jgi:hypothetical protein
LIVLQDPAADPNRTDLRRFPFGLSLSKPSLPFDKLRANGRIWQAIALKSVPLGCRPTFSDLCTTGKKKSWFAAAGGFFVLTVNLLFQSFKNSRSR